MTLPAPPRLAAVTRETIAHEDLLALADPHTPLVWSRRGDGFVGIGRPLIALEASADAATRLASTWRAIADAASVDDEVHAPGTGLLAFGSLAFDEHAEARSRSGATSRLVVPPVVVGRTGGKTWITRITREEASDQGEDVAPIPYGPYWSATLGPGAQSPEDYTRAVAEAVARIGRGELEKVVLARDLVGSVPAGADLRRLVRALQSGYPDTWTFAVGGLIGASPETLVTVHDGTLTARVLAGTAARGADADRDAAAAVALATSQKDLDEHRFAVQSVLDALAGHTRAVTAAETPFTLKLPNVWHLATDVEGDLGHAASALDLVAVLHPTAAVAGTPTASALATIRELEPFDRGRYAGPVGWIDGDGDGEWAIALRCAQFGAESSSPTAEDRDDIPVTAFAGAGIVASSDPEAELLETRVKFRPIVDALA
ncbi:MAG: chorismate-binding protein [Microbacterium ginsengisoli]|nr:chorismate-binding protein [Microbacterium ginsengisoli]